MNISPNVIKEDLINLSKLAERQKNHRIKNFQIEF